MHKLIEDLNTSIDDNNKDSILFVLDEMENSVGSDADLVNDITTPEIYTNIKTRLVEDMGVPIRSMLIKGRVVSRKKRAFYFIKALKNGALRIE